jgi:hypothetical protein
MKRFLRKARGDESGVLIVEATILIPLFMVAIFTVLSLVTITAAQGKIAIALNQSALELSQYGYVKSMNSADMLGKIDELTRVVSGVLGGASDDLVNTNPASVALSSSGSNGAVIAKEMMKKHLGVGDEAGMTALLEDWGVSGLSFDGSVVYGGDREINLVVKYDIEPLKWLGNLTGFHFKFPVISTATTQSWGQGG